MCLQSEGDKTEADRCQRERDTTKWQALDKHKDKNKYWPCLGSKRSASYHIVQKKTLFPQTESHHCAGLPGLCRDQKSPRKVAVTCSAPCWKGWYTGQAGLPDLWGERRGGKTGTSPFGKMAPSEGGAGVVTFRSPFSPQVLPKGFLQLIFCRGGQVHCPHFPAAVA